MTKTTPFCYLVLEGVITLPGGLVGIIDSGITAGSGIINAQNNFTGLIDDSVTAVESIIDTNGVNLDGEIQEYLSINAPLCD